MTSPRTLDHLVLCVHDLAAAGATYQALGFTLTPPATHPFGTRNRLVQMPGGNFLELVALGETAVTPAQEQAGQFSFARRTENFLRDSGEGMAMLVCASADARADVQEFGGAGLTTYDPFDFARDATLPDGQVVRVAFSLAFVTHPALPGLALFTCQQRHAPENFWRPEFQAHANGAQRIVEVIMEADEPAIVGDVIGRFTGGDIIADPDGRTIRVGPPADRVTVMTRAALRERFPELRDVPGGASPRFAAFRIEVADTAAHRVTVAAHGMIIEFT